MGIATIRNQQDYRRALEEIEALMPARRNTRDGARLAALVTLVEDWERKHYPFSSALPH
jgi:HTH-type transcriptional regulator / antitoxin HigA